MKSRLTATLFCLPALILFILLFWYPCTQSILLAFCDWHGFSKFSFSESYVGLDNFRSVFHDQIVLRALRNVAILTVIPGVVILGASLIFCFCCWLEPQKSLKHRAVAYLPATLPAAATAVLWSSLLNSLKTKTPWLSPELLLWSILPYIIWAQVGFFAILYAAAASRIPRSLSDAARLDGAGAIRTFQSIILPLLKPTHTVAVIFLVLGGLRHFEGIWIFSNGLPSLSNETIGTWFYQRAFSQFDLGYATALALLLTIAGAIVMIFGGRFGGKAIQTF